jgi:hypothetical protein
MVASVLLSADLDALLGLDGLVQAFVVAAADHQAAGELVHDDDLAVLDDVVDVPLHDAVGLDRLVDVVGDRHVLGSERFSILKKVSALRMPLSVRVQVLCFSSTT